MPIYNLAGVGSFNLNQNDLNEFDKETLEGKLRAVASRPNLHTTFGFIPDIVDDSYGSALKYGVATAANNLGQTLDVFDDDDGGFMDRFSEYLKSFETPDNYDPAFASLKDPDDEDTQLFGVGIGSLPRAITEQVPQFAGSLVSRSIGAGAGGLLGLAVAGPGGAVTGAALGGISLPILFETAQILGPLAYERARNNNRTEPNIDDLKGAGLAAVASGAINSFALNGLLKIGGGPALRFIKGAAQEGLTETGQGLIEQVGGTLATDKGLEVNLRDAALEGLVGAGLGGPLAFIGNDSTRASPDFGEEVEDAASEEGDKKETDTPEPLSIKTNGVDPDTEVRVDGASAAANILNDTAQLLPLTTYGVRKKSTMYYVAQEGDTLDKISNRFNVTGNEIAVINSAIQNYTKNRVIAEGTELKLPSSVVSSADTTDVAGYQVVGFADPNVAGSEDLAVSGLMGTEEEAKIASDVINESMEGVASSQEDNIFKSEIRKVLKSANIRVDDAAMESVEKMSFPTSGYSIKEIEALVPNAAARIKKKFPKPLVFIEEAVSAVGAKEKSAVADSLIKARNNTTARADISPALIQKELDSKKIQTKRKTSDGESKPDSKLKTFLKRVTGSDDIDAMSDTQRTVLLDAVSDLPSFETEIQLPIADRVPYDGKQLSEVIRSVRNSKNKVLNEKIVAQALGVDKLTRGSFKAVRRNLLARNIIGSNNKLLSLSEYTSGFRSGRTPIFKPPVKNVDASEIDNPKYTDEFNRVAAEYKKELKQQLDRVGLGELVTLEAVPDVEYDGAGEGQTVEGSTVIPENVGEKYVIQLALKLDPNQGEDTQKRDLAGVLNHEAWHVLQSLAGGRPPKGPLRRKDFAVLDRVIASAVKPDRTNGDGYNNRTYFEVARDQYPDLTTKNVKEEAYAELFRDWSDGVRTYRTTDGKRVVQPRTIFEKVWQYFFAVKGALIASDIDSAFDVFSRIGSDRDQDGSVKQIPLEDGRFDNDGTETYRVEGDRVVKASLTNKVKNLLDKSARDLVSGSAAVDTKGGGTGTVVLSDRTLLSTEKVDNEFIEPVQDPNGNVKVVAKNSVPELAKKLSSDVVIGETEGNLPVFARLLASSSLSALGDNNSAIGWYESVLGSAMKVLEKVEPSILDSEKNKTAFQFALAVTSNQTKVDQNFKNALKAYRSFKKNGLFLDDAGKLPGSGKTAKVMRASFKFYNDVAQNKYPGMVIENPAKNQVTLQDFLNTDFYLGTPKKFAKDNTYYQLEVDGKLEEKIYSTRTEVNRAAKNTGREDFNIAEMSSATPNLTSLSEFISDLGIDLKVSDQMLDGTIVKGSYVLGPKIGNGFYQNIGGNYDALTMDLWWTRMWHRLRGDPFVPGKGKEYTQKKLTELQSYLDNEYDADSTDGKILKNIFDAAGLSEKVDNDSLVREDINLLNTRWEGYYNLDQKRSRLNSLNKNNDLQGLENYQSYEEYRADINAAYKARDKAGYKKAAATNPNKSSFFTTVTTAKAALKDAAVALPKDGVQREYMIRASQDAIDILYKDEGIDINMADFQALLWYPEKRLYERFGAGASSSLEESGNAQDYLEAALEVATEEITDATTTKEIEKIASDSKESRAIPSIGGRGGDSRVSRAVTEMGEGVRQANETGLPLEKIISVRKGQSEVATSTPFFEIAPDPKDKAAVKAWNALSPEAKARVSNFVINDISSTLFGTFKVSGRLSNSIGSYGSDTNPAYALTMVDGSPGESAAIEVSKAIGYALRQESIFLVSSKKREGFDESGLVYVDVGNVDMKTTEEIYLKLRENKDLAIQGQSLVDGRMMILNQSSLDQKTWEDKIEAALPTQPSGAKYQVESGTAYINFVEEDSYNYDRVNGKETVSGGDGKAARVRNRFLREKADAIFKSAVGQETQKIKVRGDKIKASLSGRVAPLPIKSGLLQGKLNDLEALLVAATKRGDQKETSRLLDTIGLMYLGEYRDVANIRDKEATLLNNLNATSVKIGSSINKYLPASAVGTPASTGMEIGIDSFLENAPTTKPKGAPVGTKKTTVNLYKRRKAGWKWVEKPDGYSPPQDFDDDLISVSHGGQHYYGLNADFPAGAKLTTYAGVSGGSFQQPSLKPTVAGTVDTGVEVGKIAIRGVTRPVYDSVTVSAQFGDQDPKYIDEVTALSQANVETDQQLMNLKSATKEQLRTIVVSNITEVPDYRAIAKEYGVDPDLQVFTPPPEAGMGRRKASVREAAKETTDSQRAVIDQVTMESRPVSLGRRITESLQSITSTSGWGKIFREARRQVANEYRYLETQDAEVAKKLGSEIRAATSGLAAALDSNRSKIFQNSMWFLGGKAEYVDGGFRVVPKEDGGGKPLIEIFSRLTPETIRAFQTYVAGIRARRLIVENRERLMTDDDIEVALTLGETYPEFEEIRLEWNAWNENFVRNVGVSSGVLSQEQADIFLENSDYIPFTRKGDEVSNHINTTINYPTLTIDGLIEAKEEAEANQKRMRELKTLTGNRETFRVFVNDKVIPYVKPYRDKREAEKEAQKYKDLNPDQDVTVRVTGVPLDNFFESLIQNIDTITSSAMKNVAHQRILAQGELMGTAERRSSMKPGYYTVRVKGETQYYDVIDSDMAQALRSLNDETRVMTQGVGKWLTLPTYVLREAVTRMPNFIIKSLNRDSVAAWQTSGRDVSPIISGWAGFGEALVGSKSSRAVRGAMGYGGYDFRGNYENMADVVKRGIERKGPGPVSFSPTKNVKRLWDWAGQASNAADAAVRIKVYDKVFKETGDWVQAAYEARQVIDYTRRGANKNLVALTSMLTFLNARIQGIDLLRVGFGSTDTANPDYKRVLKAFWARGMAVTSVTALLWMLQHEDEDWKNQKSQERDMNFILTPKVFGLPADSKPFKYPVSFELGTMFKILPERTLEYVWGQDSNKDMKEALIRNLTATLGLNPIPQAFKPLVEVATNYNMFTGNPIVNPYILDRAPRDQYGAGTSEFARVLGDSLNISPLKIDHFIAGYTGPLGASANLAMSAILREFTGAPEPAMREIERSILNPLGRETLLSSEPTGTLNQYYDLKAAIDEVYKGVKLKPLRKVSLQDADLLRYRDYIYSIDKEIKDLNQTARIINDSGVSSIQKRDFLRTLAIKKNALTAKIPAITKQIYG